MGTHAFVATGHDFIRPPGWHTYACPFPSRVLSVALNTRFSCREVFFFKGFPWGAGKPLSPDEDYRHSTDLKNLCPPALNIIPSLTDG